jgi:hypothetical protein
MAQRDEIVRPPLALPGGGSELIRFKVIATGSPYQQDSQTCTTVLAEVMDVMCEGASVDVGDEIIVWDPWGCWFDIPIDTLANALGFATKLQKNDTYDISECANDDPNQSCFWNCLNLCCQEEVYVS